jgi:hypothetical protein
MGRTEPNEVTAAALLWLIAVAAGVFETGLAALDAVSGGAGLDAEFVRGALLRLVAFAAVGVLIAELRRGRAWARLSLAVFLGGFGTISTLVGPVRWLLEGHPLTTALESGPTLAALSRAVHLAAMVAALVMMFRPAANAYFHSGRRLAGPPLVARRPEDLPHSAAPHQQPPRQQMPVAGEEDPVDRPARLRQPRPRLRPGHDDHVARRHAHHQLAGHRRGQVVPH